jgi:hypothetical protein
MSPVSLEKSSSEGDDERVLRVWQQIKPEMIPTVFLRDALSTFQTFRDDIEKTFRRVCILIFFV